MDINDQTPVNNHTNKPVLLDNIIIYGNNYHKKHYKNFEKFFHNIDVLFRRKINIYEMISDEPSNKKNFIKVNPKNIPSYILSLDRLFNFVIAGIVL